MSLKSCHSEKDKIFCDHCLKTVWQWATEKDGTNPLDWLVPMDCPYCGVGFTEVSISAALEALHEWMMTTRTDIVYG